MAWDTSRGAILLHSASHVNTEGEMAEPPQVPQCCIEDCALAIDIVLESSDGIQFGAHSKNLELYSSAFPPADFFQASSSFEPELVRLSELADVVALLLRYMHHHRQPDSGEIPFEVMNRLAEAVEKYVIFSAMEVCHIRMREVVSTQPLNVLRYAMKHGYHKLCNEAAPATISISMKEAREVLGNDERILLTWIIYRENWMEILLFANTIPPYASTLHRGGMRDCEEWPKFYSAVLTDLDGKLDNLRDVDVYIEDRKDHIDSCPHCVRRADRWKALFKERLDRIPKISDLL